MKASNTNNKYFPINLQKKSLIYSGSQPQIGFTPPVKTLHSSVVKHDSFKIKNDGSIGINKCTPDKQFSNQIQQQLNSIKTMNKSIGMPKNPYQQELKELNNSRNIDLNSTYSKYVKIEKDISRERIKNELLCSAPSKANILNGNSPDIIRKPSFKGTLQSQVQVLKSLQDKNEFLKFSREKSNDHNIRYIVGLGNLNNNRDTPLIIKRPSSKLIQKLQTNNEDNEVTPYRKLKKEPGSLKINDREKIQMVIKNTILTKGQSMAQLKPPVSGSSDLTLPPPISSISNNLKNEKESHITKNFGEVNFSYKFNDKQGKSLKSSSSTYNMITSSQHTNLNQDNSYNNSNIENSDRKSSLIDPEKVNPNFVGAPLSKKPIKHIHQKSLSENMNAEGNVGHQSDSVIGYAISKKTELYDQGTSTNYPKEEEDFLYNYLLLTEVKQIRNVLNYTNQFLVLDERLDQNQIENRVDALLQESFNITPESYECFNKNSKFNLNKVLNRILKYYCMLIILIKFGILEFLLNGMLQKKIKIILKVINSYLFDFVDSTIVTKVQKLSASANNGGSSNSLPVNFPKEIFELSSAFMSISKKFPTKTLNAWSFDYQTKLYEGKIMSQFKIFLE